jgi:hypothetical protein
MSAEQQFVDVDLETRINDAALALATARDTKMRRFWWEALERLHKQRSPERVAEMETERGLAR